MSAIHNENVRERTSRRQATIPAGFLLGALVLALLTAERGPAATLAFKAGEHPKVVSERLGHSSVSITLDVYSHAVPGLQRESAARVPL